MSVSPRDQLQVQQMIEAASAENRRDMRAEAEATLAQVNVLIGLGYLSKESRKSCEIAIEILMRIEATEQGKGWWFRTRYRMQLIQMYLGS